MIFNYQDTCERIITEDATLICANDSEITSHSSEYYDKDQYYCFEPVKLTVFFDYHGVVHSAGPNCRKGILFECNASFAWSYFQEEATIMNRQLLVFASR